jgi:uncharacterized protein with NRDE domain
MCLVLIALEAHPDFSLILAANRDEFYDRPTSPADFWSDAPGVLAGRDLKAGGTWLGITQRGRLAAVTNYRQGRREAAAPRSRGLLVSEFLTKDIGARAHLERVQREATLYHGFNLLASDHSGLFYYSNREDRIRSLEPGLHGLSNHLIDTPWPKVVSSKAALSAVLNLRGPELVPALFALLSDRKRATDDRLPSTGIGQGWERLLSSAFVASAEYGTRSSTVVLVGRDGGVVFVERSFGSSGTPGTEVRFQLETTSGN